MTKTTPNHISKLSYSTEFFLLEDAVENLSEKIAALLPIFDGSIDSFAPDNANQPGIYGVRLFLYDLEAHAKLVKTEILNRRAAK